MIPKEKQQKGQIRSIQIKEYDYPQFDRETDFEHLIEISCLLSSKQNFYDAHPHALPPSLYLSHTRTHTRTHTRVALMRFHAHIKIQVLSNHK